MSIDAHHVIKSPIITEESQIQQSKANQYTFRVSAEANKAEIRDAVEDFFDVKVLRVNTMNYQGKLRRQFGSRSTGRRTNWKKAIVTLRAGDKIDLI